MLLPRRLAYFTLALTAFGCSADATSRNNSTSSDESALSDYASLFDGAPENAALPFDIKADGPAPRLFTELLSDQSSVKSQGKRGVCSIFSTTALMESLYIKAGVDSPDFSEQYLQWSAKFEVGSFPDSSGSNAQYNLQAINRFGIPEESAWPYEEQQWNEFDDPECAEDNEDQPTRCYTNGEPPAEALSAEKFFLPRGGWVNTSRASLIDHMRIQKTGVLVGLDFFYQSWNHRKSDLPRNMDAWDLGVVAYPNDEDIRISQEKRAGHSILLVGWDLDIAFPRYDENGDPLLDSAGQPVMEEGFFIFKNSWGTSGFGIENPYGAGYGYISMRYVEEHGWGRTSSVPELEPGGGETEPLELRSDESVLIPDNDPAGIVSVLQTDSLENVESVTVSVNIAHSYRSDLRVAISHGDTEVVLHDQNGGAEADLNVSWTLDDFAGQTRAGDWVLTVSDNVAQDSGELQSWSIALN